MSCNRTNVASTHEVSKAFSMSAKATNVCVEARIDRRLTSEPTNTSAPTLGLTELSFDEWGNTRVNQVLQNFEAARRQRHWTKIPWARRFTLLENGDNDAVLPQRWDSTPRQDKVEQLHQRTLPPRKHHLEKGVRGVHQGQPRTQRIETRHIEALTLNGLSKTPDTGGRAQRSANLLMMSAWKDGSNELDDRDPTDMKCWRHCSRGSCSGQRTQCVWSRRD